MTYDEPHRQCLAQERDDRPAEWKPADSCACRCHAGSFWLEPRKLRVHYAGGYGFRCTRCGFQTLEGPEVLYVDREPLVDHLMEISRHLVYPVVRQINRIFPPRCRRCRNAGLLAGYSGLLQRDGLCGECVWSPEP